MNAYAPQLVVQRRPSAQRPGRWGSLDLAQLPFKAVLSLEPLLAYWQEHVAASGGPGMRALFESLQEELARRPALRGPLPGPDVLNAHRDVLEPLLLPLFPPAFRDREMAAALSPFEFKAFFATPPFTRYLTQENGTISGRVNLDVHAYTYGKLITAYLHVLREVYGVPVPFEHPVVLTTTDPDTGLSRYLRLTSDLRFLRVKPLGQPPALDAATQQHLLSNLSDLALWRTHLPADRFLFEGFNVSYAHDVTDHEVITRLERDLAEGDSVFSGTTLPLLKHRLQTVLKQPGLELGLATIDDAQLFLVHDPVPRFSRGSFSHTHRHDLDAIEASIFSRCLRERSIQVAADLAEQTPRTPLEEDLLDGGVRHLVAAPLISRGRPTGILYLWSREPGTLHGLNVMKLNEVLPIFAAAVMRSRQTLQNQVQDVILGKYAAIHPSVEWRFREAALNFIHARERGNTSEVEPIVFQDVYPLYAASDIRGSSMHRNEAVQYDLLAHLSLAEDVLKQAREVRPLALLHHLLARAARYHTALSDGLSSGDETAVQDFLHNDVEPLMDQLRVLDPKVDQAVDHYQRALNDDGELYRRCREFEESVTCINDTISDFLDAEQEKAQAVFPHYFEKHKTDGVDFNIYVGASLLESGDFDPLYVNILRLWQLMVMCGIAQRMGPLRETLTVPLDATNLILVQNTPISIRFRFDENRFDVDGTPHIRYEIMKQRVEKACIMDTDERVTQPGRIAIVYSQDREAAEYRRYIAYLQERGFLMDEVESFQLADLQGMKGLRALRVHPVQDRRIEIDPDVIEGVVRNLQREAA